MQTDEQQDLIYALAASHNAELIFAARASGLYTSLDGGKTWQSAYRSLFQNETLPTLAVALSPAFERDHTVMAGVPGAILRSQDGGEAWSVYRLQDPAPLVSAIAFSPHYEHDGTVFAVSSDDGVFCSYDFGGSWNNWNFGLLDANGLCLAVSPAFARDRGVFVGVSTGLFHSSNGGKSWQGVDLPCGDQAVLSMAAWADEGQTYLLIGVDGHGLYRSSDGGKTWTQVSWAQVSAAQGSASLENRSIDMLLAVPDSAVVAALVEETLMISTDRGDSFHGWPGAEAILTICAAEGAKLVAAQSEQGMVRVYSI